MHKVGLKNCTTGDIALVTGDDEQMLWQQPILTEQDIAQRLHQWAIKRDCQTRCSWRFLV